MLEYGVTADDSAVSRYYQLVARPRECHVQFAVDGHSIFLKAVGGEEIELIWILNGERINNDITLRTLITLHGIDGNLLQWRYAQRHSYLVAIGHDDAHRLLRREVFVMLFVDAFQLVAHDSCLANVHLVGTSRLSAVVRGDVDESLVRVGWFALMFQRDRNNILTGIKHAAWECRDVGVHASLLMENAYELFPARTSLNSQQTLKETVTAVVKADVLQALLLHPAVVDALLNHRRQLLVVSNEDETGGG